MLDAQGNLYGTTVEGGNTTSPCTYLGSCGTVFKVDATGKETVLYRFTGTGGDGANPMAGLVLDAQGNLYGTTYSGGDASCRRRNFSDGCGDGCSSWIPPARKPCSSAALETATTAAGPYGGLVLDAEGNLYGTTFGGGSGSSCEHGCGTVFKVDTSGNGTVLYSFAGGADSAYPDAGLVRDAEGDLYGTTRGVAWARAAVLPVGGR